MTYKNVKLTLVSLKQPCSACLITYNLAKEMLDMIAKQCNHVILEDIELNDFKDITKVEGLEVEKFPVVLVNGEQITAGSLPRKSQLMSIIESEATHYEKN